ncbi:MAG: hypothetical protein HOV81_02200 [Kofleriaceae bacterium]|nr:hypothetical protein [Kofleriaceae bacterium]
MGCPRCGAESGPAPETEPTAIRLVRGRAAWCSECESNYDVWVRKHAGDIVWPALCGMVVVAVVGVGLPILGVGSLVAALGAFAGFATVFALSRLTRRRRRRQFLLAPLPRAYLPAPK